MSSAVLTMTVSPPPMCACSPCASRAPPTPPARRTTEDCCIAATPRRLIDTPLQDGQDGAGRIVDPLILTGASRRDSSLRGRVACGHDVEERRMSQHLPTLRARLIAFAAAILLLPQLLVISGFAAAGCDDSPVLRPGAQPLVTSEEDEARLLALDTEFIDKRLAGDRPLTISEAGQLRSAAAHQAQQIRKNGIPPSGPSTFAGPWSLVGPNPIVQVTRSTPIFSAMSGRIGALAIR